MGRLCKMSKFWGKLSKNEWKLRENWVKIEWILSKIEEKMREQIHTIFALIIVVLLYILYVMQLKGFWKVSKRFLMVSKRFLKGF